MQMLPRSELVVQMQDRDLLVLLVSEHLVCARIFFYMAFCIPFLIEIVDNYIFSFADIAMIGYCLGLAVCLSYNPAITIVIGRKCRKLLRFARLLKQNSGRYRSHLIRVSNFDHVRILCDV